MKKIIFSLLTVFVLFSCQSEMDIEPIELATNDVVVTRSSSHIPFSYTYLEFVSDPFYPNCIPFVNSQSLYLMGIGEIMFQNYPIIASLAEDLCKNNPCPLRIGLDPTLEGLATYLPAKRYIFFKSMDQIIEKNLMHEFLHAIQQDVILCDMYDTRCRKNREYEVFVAQDILLCIKQGGFLSIDQALGKPDYIYDIEQYSRGIEDIVRAGLAGDVRVFDLAEKFNTWIQNWHEYTDHEYTENYQPLLLYNILYRIASNR